MNCGAKPRLISTPFQVTSRLPMSSTSVRSGVPMEYAATGVRDTRRGSGILFSVAQRLREVHVDTVVAGRDRVAAGKVRGAGNGWRALGAVQFSAEVSPPMAGS